MQVVKNITEDVPPPAPICVVGDVYRVEQQRHQVLSPGRRHPSEGEQRSVSNTATSRESICDPRPGILSEGGQAELFTGVFRVQSDQLQQGKGSGLGLALCKQIVTLYGGTVGVESKERRGSIFYSAFPVTQQRAGWKRAGEDASLIFYYPTLQYHR